MPQVVRALFQGAGQGTGQSVPLAQRPPGAGSDAGVQGLPGLCQVPEVAVPNQTCHSPR